MVVGIRERFKYIGVVRNAETKVTGRNEFGKKDVAKIKVENGEFIFVKNGQ